MDNRTVPSSLGVVVKKDKNTSEYYLHEVIDEDGNIAVLNKKRAEPFKTESFVSKTSLGGSTLVNNSIPHPDNTVNKAIWGRTFFGTALLTTKERQGDGFFVLK